MDGDVGYPSGVNSVLWMPFSLPRGISSSAGCGTASIIRFYPFVAFDFLYTLDAAKILLCC